MRGTDIRKLAVFMFNWRYADFCAFYGKPEFDSYVRDKFTKMRNDGLAWIGELDSEMLNKLAEAVNNYEG